jgi:hypothetical protein
MKFEEIRYESLEILSFHSFDTDRLEVLYNGTNIEVWIMDEIFTGHYKSGVIRLNLGAILTVEMKILKEFDLAQDTIIHEYHVTKIISGYQLG